MKANTWLLGVEQSMENRIGQVPDLSKRASGVTSNSTVVYTHGVDNNGLDVFVMMSYCQMTNFHLDACTYSIVWYGTVWCCVVWCGIAWHGMAWHGLA